MSDFDTRFMAASREEAETKALAACRNYYGDQVFTMSVSSTERRTFGGDVIGYDVSVSAQPAPDGRGMDGDTSFHFERDSTDSA